MSISGTVPIRNREKTIIQELKKEGKPVKTGELTKRVLARLGLSAAERNRTTPGGYPWWSGCIRFDLDRMRKHGEVRRPTKGYWEIISGNGKTSPNPGPDKYSRRALNILADIVRSVKSGEVQALITMKDGEFTVKIGEDIKKTSIQ
jgi:hypothetical protein